MLECFEEIKTKTIVSNDENYDIVFVFKLIV